MYGKSIISVIALMCSSVALASTAAKVTIDSGSLVGTPATGTSVACIQPLRSAGTDALSLEAVAG